MADPRLNIRRMTRLMYISFGGNKAKVPLPRPIAWNIYVIFNEGMWQYAKEHGWI